MWLQWMYDQDGWCTQMKGCIRLDQGFSNYDTRTTSGTPATVQWYTGLVRKKLTDKK
jgi:hypothetical protein